MKKIFNEFYINKLYKIIYLYYYVYIIYVMSTIIFYKINRYYYDIINFYPNQ